MSLQKLPDKWSCGFFTDLVGRPDLFDAAGIHDHNAVGDLNRFVLIVSDEEGGDLELALELFDPAPEFFADHGIQSTEWFVQQEDPRFDGQRARQGNPLALSARQLRGQTIFKSGKLNQTREARKLVPESSAGFKPVSCPGNLQTKGDIFVNRHVAKQARNFEKRNRLASFEF